MEKETICWGCQNFSKCSWSKGVPVEGWDATPTKFIDKYGLSDPIEVNSFIVNSCPQFKADTKQRVSVSKIAKIINISPETIFRLSRNQCKRKYLRDLLKEKGYMLYIYEDICRTGKCRNTYYLERVENESN